MHYFQTDFLWYTVLVVGLGQGIMGLNTDARLKAKGARRIKYLSPYALSLVPYARYYFYPVKLIFYFTEAMCEAKAQVYKKAFIFNKLYNFRGIN